MFPCVHFDIHLCTVNYLHVYNLMFTYMCVCILCRRFPCCGKAFPCDVCHDTKEDHPYELANRMICGHCAKEQVIGWFGPGHMFIT